ncbi:glycoside hydrolase family 10 protein [Halpernia sp. GG3]
MSKNFFRFLFFSFFLFIFSCATKKPVVKPAIKIIKIETKPPVLLPAPAKAVALILPEVPREFRAAWIATVANINWPSRNNLSTEEQKAEAIKLLDLLKENNFNAVIFQARPSADALYDSKLEPWSYFLTGETGKAPNPYYDPLEFWITEAHKRGLELHVWLNPFRAYHTTGGKITSESIVNTMSEDVVKLRNGTYWMDPSSENTQNHVSEVVKDLVKRYDLDGIHFDDYFYPYREYNGGRDFPDTKSWTNYLKMGGSLSRADWRRANVNKFVKRIYNEIKAEKNDVKFGISPFGIWKPGFPSDVAGSSQYDELYADAKLWLNQGWIDYFSPQLYWPIDSPKQNFNSLLNWWSSENTQKRHLWPGLNTVEIKAANRPEEIVSQINSIRTILPTSKGEIHYSIAGLLKSSAMTHALKNIPYREKALVPETPWLKTISLKKPGISLLKNENNILVKWTSEDLDNVREWLLYTKYGDNWSVEILTPDILSKRLEQTKLGKNLLAIAVKSVGKLGNESPYEASVVN